MSPFSIENLKKTLVFLLVSAMCAAVVSCGRHKLRPDELERNRLFAEILKREDRRTLGDDAFFRENLSGSPYPQVQEWCAVALGRIGNPRALPWLFDAFQAQYAAVRAAAAFAVGEIEDREMLRQEGRSLNEHATIELRRLLDDRALSVQMRAVEALGKLGAHADAIEIIRRIEAFHQEGSPLQTSFLDLAIMALARLKDPAALPVLEKLAGDSDPEVQWRAANALIRMRDKGAAPVFLRLLASPRPDVRAYAARGVGICGDPGLARRLEPLLPPRDVRTGLPIPLAVRVCAVQSLGNLKNAGSAPSIQSALEAEPVDEIHPDQVNFAIHAVAALANIGSAGSEAAFLKAVKAGGPAADSSVLALARMMTGSPDRFFSLVTERQFAGPAAKRAWAQALGELGGARALEELRGMLGRSLEENAASARRPLLVARSRYASTLSPDMLAVPAVLKALSKMEVPDLDELLKPFLISHDGVVLRSAVDAYKAIPVDREPWVPVAQAYGVAAQVGDLETKVAVLNGLEPWVRQPVVQDTLRSALHDGQRNVRIAASRLLRQSGAVDVPEDPGDSGSNTSDITYEVLAAGRKDRTGAVIETTRGNIEVELFREDAPLTVANFVSLAKQGFYDGLSFMRVVPFFVIQGGDPRNDQEGGPGYTIRCEINMRPYERGSIGMALSGKDTGGSQFFITLAPQPHLDGGYTCFGRVISGMQVAERIVPGDRIKKIVIQEDQTFLDYRAYQ